MTADLRRQAKTINFGIIYGISAFGLAQRLSIPHGDAAAFIRQYFERFPGIRTYIDDIKKRIAASNGYVTTLFGRVCHYPQIKSGNPNERARRRAAGHQRADPGHRPPTSSAAP